MSTGTGAAVAGDGGGVEVPNAAPADAGAAPAPVETPAAPTETPPASAAPETPPTADEGEKAPSWGEYRRLRKQLRERETEIESSRGQYEQERSTWQAERGALSAKARDYDVLAQAIQNDPDFASEVEARLAGKRTSDTPAGRAAATLPPEMVGTLKRMESFLAEHDRQRQQQAQRAQFEQAEREKQEVAQHVQGVIGEKFKKWGYDVDILGEAAEGYVARRIQQMLDKREDVDLSDIPFILNEWYGKQETAYRKRQGITVNGAARDARELPPTPAGGAGQPPINGRQSLGANDATTARAIEDALRQRGWSG